MKKSQIFISAIALLLLVTVYLVFSRPAKVDQSVAVLPFVNMNDDPEQVFLSDGLTEGILNSLARQEGLTVVARSSSFKFREDDMGIQEIGKMLGVRSIVEGSLYLQGDQVRVTAQLINVEDSRHLWSQRYDGTSKDIFEIQDKIANTIADVLLRDKGEVVTKRAANNEAYQAYLNGRAHWNLRTPDDLKKGIVYFEDAIAKDPQYGAAYGGMADCYLALGYGSYLAPKDAFPKAFDAATKALALDSTLAEAHATLGHYMFYYKWDWAAAEQEFRKAISMNPNHELAYDWYGYYLTAMQRYDEAQVVLEKASSLDPLSSPIAMDIGFSLYYSGAYDEAMAALKTALDLNPKNPIAHIWMGRSLQAKQRYNEAISEYKQALEVTPGWNVAWAQIGNAYGVSGNTAEAKSVLDTLNSFASKKFVTSYGVALIHASLGDKEEAFKWLDKAYDERSHWLVWLRTDPRWTPLRSDKRFAELLAKVGLPEVNE